MKESVRTFSSFVFKQVVSEHDQFSQGCYLRGKFPSFDIGYRYYWNFLQNLTFIQKLFRLDH